MPPVILLAHPAGRPPWLHTGRRYDDDPTIRFRRPVVAIVRIYWTQSGAIGLDDKETVKRSMIMSLVVTKENGVWGIASYHNMDRRTDQPKEIPAELLQKR